MQELPRGGRHSKSCNRENDEGGHRRSEVAGGSAMSDADLAKSSTTAKGLIVDHEPAVLRLMAVLVRNAGYEVLQPDGGDDALAIWESSEC
jgi:hypothetical protein